MTFLGVTQLANLCHAIKNREIDQTPIQWPKEKQPYEMLFQTFNHWVDRMAIICQNINIEHKADRTNTQMVIDFRKKVYGSVEELQQDLDTWIEWYNKERTHSGKFCYGKTPQQTFLDTIHIAKEKLIDQNQLNLNSFSVKV